MCSSVKHPFHSKLYLQLQALALCDCMPEFALKACFSSTACMLSSSASTKQSVMSATICGAVSYLFGPFVFRPWADWQLVAQVMDTSLHQAGRRLPLFHQGRGLLQGGLPSRMALHPLVLKHLVEHTLSAVNMLTNRRTQQCNRH